MSTEEALRRNKRAASFVLNTGRTFLNMAEIMRGAVNGLPAADEKIMQILGADPNYLYYWSAFGVRPDEALLFHLPEVPLCENWGMCLYNFWLESLDYSRARINLNKFTATPEPGRQRDHGHRPSSAGRRQLAEHLRPRRRRHDVPLDQHHQERRPADQAGAIGRYRLALGSAALGGLTAAAPSSSSRGGRPSARRRGWSPPSAAGSLPRLGPGVGGSALHQGVALAQGHLAVVEQHGDFARQHHAIVDGVPSNACRSDG